MKRNEQIASQQIQNLATQFFPNLTITALDIGARHGLNSDLIRIAPLTNYYGFEPDQEEYARLIQAQNETDWRKTRYIPSALYSQETELSLNLYRQRGCSSVLEADKNIGSLFEREEYYILDGSIQMQARPLDQLVSEHGIASPDFMKIDVQGAEIECFKGGSQCLGNDLLAIRTEVSFAPIYKNQPLFSHIDQFLQPLGFAPMRFLELHEWRRDTRAKLPALAGNERPFSHGQMIHGDVLYFRRPESFDEGADPQKLIKLALLALCYDHYDMAVAVFQHPRLKSHIPSQDIVQIINAINSLSAKQATIGRALHSMSDKFRKFLKV